MGSVAPPEILADPEKYSEWIEENKDSTVIGVVAFTLFIAIVCVVLRLYTRLIIIKQFGIDDVFAILSLLVTIGVGFAIAYMTKFGLGRHVDFAVTLDASETGFPTLYLRNFYVSIVLYCAALFLIKQCFLFQYYRIFGINNMRFVFIGAIIIVGAWSLSQVFVGIFMCVPVEAFWKVMMQPTNGGDAHCIPTDPQFKANAAGNIFTDVVVFVLPLPVLKTLNLGKRQKYMLMGIFSLGFFTVALSVLRIKYLAIPADLTWQNADSSLWSIAELSSGITCACLPTFRPLVSHHFPGLVTRISGSSRASYSRKSAPSSRQSRPREVSEASRMPMEPMKELWLAVNGSTRDVEEGSMKSTNTEEDRLVGLKTTVRWDIQSTGEVGEDVANKAIQVQRDVVQIKASKS